MPSSRPVIVSESFVVVDWTDPGSHPGRLIAGLHLHRSDDEAWIEAVVLLPIFGEVESPPLAVVALRDHDTKNEPA